MLDKEDINIIRKIVTDSLGDFFEKALGPYLDKKFEENDNDHDTIFRKFDEIDDHLVDHGKRIKKLETTLNS